jgi:hypothetical protein
MTERREKNPIAVGRSAAHRLRLLPWVTPDGKPCYLSASGSQSMMSRLADGVEEEQTAAGAEVLEEALKALALTENDPKALRAALRQTATSLGNVLRVAESRGARIPVHDDEDGGGPMLPADAFG